MTHTHKVGYVRRADFGYNEPPVTTTFTTAPSAIGAGDQDLALGHEVGEYRIERVLGKGGFGTVYGAVQPVIGKHVAIKVLARKYSADPDMVSRFVAEARAVNQIRHRNIIDIFSFSQLSDGRHYYVMEYLDGQPLDSYIRDHGAMPLGEALPILRAIARALDAAHAKGIAHRDLKPENIFLAQDPDGSAYPKLLDFGIAKLLAPDDDVRHRTGTGVPIGTPYYMSPEQCRGREVDHRTDVYSFGIVAYRLLTGTLPFEGDDYMELLFKQSNEEAAPPSTRNPQLTPAVDAAIAWMMRKDRAQRPPSVFAAVQALDPDHAITVPPPLARSSKPTRPPKRTTDALAATFTPEFERPALEVAPVKRSASRWSLLAGALFVLVAGVIAAFVLVSAKPVQTPPAAPQPGSPAAADVPAPAGERPVVTPVVAPVVTPVAAPDETGAPAGSATASNAPSRSAPDAPTRPGQAKRPARTQAIANDAPPAPTTPTPTSKEFALPAKGDIIHIDSDAFKPKQ
jgi:eukaryotic-like serine/threonine-protein kinase